MRLRLPYARGSTCPSAWRAFPVAVLAVSSLRVAVGLIQVEGCRLCAACVQAAPVVLLVLREGSLSRHVSYGFTAVKLRDRHIAAIARRPRRGGPRGGARAAPAGGAGGGVRDVCQLVWQSGTSGSLPNGDEMEASYSLDTLHSCRRGSTQGRRQLHLCELGRRGPSGAERGGRERHAMPASSIESERRHARKPNGATRIDARAHAPRLTPKSIFFTVALLYIISCVIWGPFDLLIHRCGMSAPLVELGRASRGGLTEA
jgi:hypothetical protein